MLLETITKAAGAAAGHEISGDLLHKYPIILNAESILSQLEIEDQNPDESLHIKQVSGWDISKLDSQIIDSTTKLFNKLKRKLKARKSFTAEEFLQLLDSFLETNSQRVGVSVNLEVLKGSKYTKGLIEKLDFLICPELAALISECCLVHELWDLLETLIVRELISLSAFGPLIEKLVEKKKSHLLCVCVKSAIDLLPTDIVCVMKYFLSPENLNAMQEIREEWEGQASLAIEKVVKKKSVRNNQLAVLLMAAYDGFSSSELGLHYLFQLSNVEGNALRWAIGELDGPEVMKLLRYLGKWLEKYERFPQVAGSGWEDSELEICKWVPSMEAVVKSAGLVIDEHFSHLVLQGEFHEELRTMQERGMTLIEEARLSCGVADMIEELRLIGS